MLFGLFKREPKKNTKSLTKVTLQKKKDLRKLVKNKQYQRALQIGQDILHKVPNDEDVLFIVGGIYYMQKRYKTAISYFEKALDIGEYDTEVLILNATAHFKIGNKKKALECCNKIKEVDPKNKAVTELVEKIKGNS